MARGLIHLTIRYRRNDGKDKIGQQQSWKDKRMICIVGEPLFFVLVAYLD